MWTIEVVLNMVMTSMVVALIMIMRTKTGAAVLEEALAIMMPTMMMQQIVRRKMCTFILLTTTMMSLLWKLLLRHHMKNESLGTLPQPVRSVQAKRAHHLHPTKIQPPHAYMDAPPLLQRLLASDELDVNNTEYSDARDGIRASELNHDDYKNPSSSAGRYLANYAEPPPAPNAAQPSRRGTDASMRARASSAGDDDNDDSRSNDSDDVQDEDSELEEVRAKSALDETSRLDDKQTHLHGEEFPTIDGVPLPLQDKDESLRRKASYSSSSSSGGNDGATRSKTNGRERPV
mmetsp:Transcript_11907/g.23347  ORF Transcript_11907/g.23347 Transcript_11907/m.23347 type:complete len:290 (-) Transcript_11907:65-934(-)